jgi:hypothetical protein
LSREVDECKPLALGLGAMSGELSVDRADVMTLTTPFAAGPHTRPCVSST